MLDKDVVSLAKENTNFREVIFTGEHSQLVIMSLAVGEDIGSEVHHKNDQILYFVEGTGRVDVNDESRDVKPGDITAVPAGSHHNVTNTGEVGLKIITIYGPADHKPGTVHVTKADALKDEGPPEQ
jgi:mannose-6-phosphate isomerase-like protein (cupin superfamily)